MYSRKKFNDSFHSFSYNLAKLVTFEKFDEWVNIEYESTYECPYYGSNIYEFIKYFALSREAFSNMYYTTDTYYTHDYNIDILYGGSEDEICNYYECGGDHEEMIRRSEDQIIKISLANYIGENEYENWKAENNYTTFI